MARVLSSPDDLDAFAAFLLRGFAAEPLQFYLALEDFHRAAIQAVLDKGKPPRGDIWSRERG